MLRLNKCSRIYGPKLPRHARNMQDYVQMQPNTQVNRLPVNNDLFEHSEVSEHCKTLHFETIDMLVTNIHDRFNQEAIKKSSGVEEFLVISLNSEAFLGKDEY